MYVKPPIDVIAPSLRIEGEVVRCSLDDFRRLVFLMLHGTPFDEAWYLDTYPDVREAVASGLVPCGLDHYLRSGYLEGRMPLRIEVDAPWYLDAYPEVADAIAAGRIENAAGHFASSGWREGRRPSEMPVDEAWYRRAYPHARQRMDRHRESADRDFLRHGYTEGLKPFRVNDAD